jgi:glycine hydroxymethyltransferase
VINTQTRDYLFRGTLEEIDSEVADLIRHETARQARYLILIPSSSSAPFAVRHALSSAFHNIYAEGYPLDSYWDLDEDELLDYETRLSEFRRMSDNRYYKGTEYADIVEGLARRRMAEVFATEAVPAEALYVNVQPLSGAPANSAVYTALVNVGDTVMGMDLIVGGHLTHGSPVNRSGKFYNIVSYSIDPNTGQIDYDRMMELALQHKPRMIIGGYSSYPWNADWQKYREVADACGAYLLADVAHVAGYIAAGIYPSPVGIADVVTFTTHKSFNGPRGAVVLTHRKDLAAKLDRGVFPGEQGGPHVNQIAAVAVAAKLAKTTQYRELQQLTLENAKRLADKLQSRGLGLGYGGTETHIVNIDCKSVVGSDGTRLSGDMGARLLDLVGIVANRQTIPGDTSALRPSGIRLGTPWVTQRGFGPQEIDEVGDIIADVLLNAVPFSYYGKRRLEVRAKLDFDLMQTAKLRVRDLAERVGIDTDVVADDYPHFYYVEPEEGSDNWQALTIRGDKAGAFLDAALTADVVGMNAGETLPTLVLHPDGREMARGVVQQIDSVNYRLTVNRSAGYVATWLRSLSDGFSTFSDDVYAKVPGPVVVSHAGSATAINVDLDAAYAVNKPYYVGRDGVNYAGPKHSPLPKFEWQEPETGELLKTALHGLHKELGAKLVEFAGYDMPVWYTSVTEEHLAVRGRAGLFDVTHMGVFDIKGPGAARFLDTVTTNDVPGLAVGSSHYTYLFDVDGVPFDDLMIYRLSDEHFLIVVNASNNDKNWAWLNAVKDHRVMIDPSDPTRTVEGADFTLRDLRDPAVGADMRVDVALQGPESTKILLGLGGSEGDQQALKSLAWAGITQVTLGGFDLIVSRTGYTGERVAYELFVHPDRVIDLFRVLVESGAVPCGLAARDSLRTEAGLPLYGHELAGSLNLDPVDAGFPTYVKLWKPFFVGKQAHLKRGIERDAVVTRFRLDSKGARPPHQGDPLVDSRGRVVGIVTSCSIDSEGYQLGQAYIKTAYSEPDTQLAVFSGSDRMRSNPDGAGMGKKFNVPDPVTVLSRFPSRKK